MSSQVTFVPGNLGSGYCMTTFQQLYLDMISQLEGFLPGNFSFINYGDDTPDPEDQDKPWVRTIAGVMDRTYVFSGGYWASPNSTPAGPNGERRLWTGDTTELATYDGGSAGAITDYTGPMWEVDTAFEGRSPMGPTATVNGTAFSVGATYGEFTHVLVEAETPKHTHTPTPSKLELSGAGDVPDAIFVGGTGPAPTPDAMTLSYFGGDGSGNTTGHNTVHPVLSTYFIKRTARKFYTV